MDLQRKTGDPIIDLAHQHRGSIAAESLARAVVERLVLIEWHRGLLLIAGGIFFIIFIIIIIAALLVLAELALFVAPFIGPPLLPLLSSAAGA